MQENIELVQKGFRILVSAMSGFIGQEMSRTYQEKWWSEVLSVLPDQYDLPGSGTYGELVDSLDIANCFRLIDRKWKDVFARCLSLNCRTWSKELMGVRNVAAHNGQQDLDAHLTERALDTMALLCNEIDADSEKEIRELYFTVRNKSLEQAAPAYAAAEQPLSGREDDKGFLLTHIGTDIVQKTTLTKKITYGGKTAVYPVYRVRLDALYYNNHNDRIATWITQYESENGTDSLVELDKEIYNHIIENFICESNHEAIERTKKNIFLVGQREPGVTLSDGRVVDGNRRFTCLRKIQRESTEPVYFETVIMDMDIHEDKKQIKLLELSIQHGEEKKVDYDLIDYAVGTYRDVVQTNLLTAEEYAASTNETVIDVKKRIEVAEVICEFLEYLGLPEQYHVAREFQVYSLFVEMMPSLKKLGADEQMTLKRIAFNNAMMKAIPDQRKFIRDIKNLISKNNYQYYFEEQERLSDYIRSEYEKADIHTKAEIDQFAQLHSNISGELQKSTERALQHYRTMQLKAKPSENISKCISLMLEVDSRQFSKMTDSEKETLKNDLEELSKIVESFRKMM